MSYLRFRLDLAIKQPIPSALQAKLDTIKDGIKILKSYAEKINEGADNEENTVKATRHVCHHDTGGECEPEVDI